MAAAVAAWDPRLHQLDPLVIVTVAVMIVIVGVVVVAMAAGIEMRADLIPALVGSAALLPGIGTDRQLRGEGVEEVEEEAGRGRLTATEVPLEVVGT